MSAGIVLRRSLLAGSSLCRHCVKLQGRNPSVVGQDLRGCQLDAQHSAMTLSVVSLHLCMLITDFDSSGLASCEQPITKVPSQCTCRRLRPAVEQPCGLFDDDTNDIHALPDYQEVEAAPLRRVAARISRASVDISTMADNPSSNLQTSFTQRFKLAALPSTLCLRTASRQNVVQSSGDHRAPLHCLWRRAGR